jgi:hypothetical protein
MPAAEARDKVVAAIAGYTGKGITAGRNCAWQGTSTGAGEIAAPAAVAKEVGGYASEI